MLPQPLGPSTTPGPGADLPDRHPDAAAPGSALGPHYRDCFGCGPQHPAGLRLRVVAGEGLTLRASFEVGPLHQGAPGLAHGGVLTAALDETLGALNWLLMRPAVTARLETSFLKPVAVGSTLELEARIMGVRGRRVYTAGLGRLGPSGPVAIAASALFVQVGAGHFARHGRDREVQAVMTGAAPGLVEMNP